MLALALLVSSRRALEDSDEAEGLGAAAVAFAVAAGAGPDDGAAADFCFGGGAEGTSVVAGCGGAEVVVAAASAEPVSPAPRLPSSSRGGLEPGAAVEPS